MKIIKDIYYGDISPKKQCLDIYLPDTNSFPVYLHIHGGGIESRDKSDVEFMAKYLTDQGVAVVGIDYRMYPSAAYPEFLRDAAQAVAWTLKNMGQYGTCEGVYVGGSSAGGYISMMLCFDKKWLAPYFIDPSDLAGFVHNAGQPTAHFNVLRERGIDSRRVIIDETAPIYHIGTAEKYAPMMFIVSDKDMENRYEQTMLTISTLKHFRYDMDKVYLEVLHGLHCEHDFINDEHGNNVLATLVYKMIQNTY